MFPTTKYVSFSGQQTDYCITKWGLLQDYLSLTTHKKDHLETLVTVLVNESQNLTFNSGRFTTEARRVKSSAVRHCVAMGLVKNQNKFQNKLKKNPMMRNRTCFIFSRLATSVFASSFLCIDLFLGWSLSSDLGFISRWSSARTCSEFVNLFRS